MNTNSAAFLYDGPLNSIPSTNTGSGLYLFHYNNDTSNGSQFYGPNTSLYDSSLGAGNIRAVGAYKNAGATYQNSMIYTGPLDGTGTWTNVAMTTITGATNAVGDTILHSTMGSLAVGNYDYRAGPHMLTNYFYGLGFIYNMTNQSYKTVSFGSYSTTIYGVWQDGIGSSFYTMIGGYSGVANGGKAYIVTYDSGTSLFTNFTSFSFNNDPSLVTGLGKLDHMRVSLWGLFWVLVGCCWVVHLRRREAVGRPETEMVRSSWLQRWQGSGSPACCAA